MAVMRFVVDVISIEPCADIALVMVMSLWLADTKCVESEDNLLRLGLLGLGPELLNLDLDFLADAGSEFGAVTECKEDL